MIQAARAFFQSQWTADRFWLSLLLRAWMLMLPMALAILPLFSETSSTARLFLITPGGEALIWAFVLSPVMLAIDAGIYCSEKYFARRLPFKKRWAAYLQASALVQMFSSILLLFWVLLMSYYAGSRDAVLFVYFYGGVLTAITSLVLAGIGRKQAQP